MKPAVIFDLDGTLIDTHDLHMDAWRALSDETDRDVAEEDLRRWFGRRATETVRALWLEDRSDDAAHELAEALTDRKESIFRAKALEALPAMEGATALLEALTGDDWRLAIGSSAPRANIDLAIELLGWSPHFGAVVAGEDVREGKPQPEVFRRAAALLDAPTFRCVVIEDAPAGIEAAHRAGMTAVGLVSTGRTPDQLKAADLVVDRLDELTPEVLTSVLARHAPGV